MKKKIKYKIPKTNFSIREFDTNGSTNGKNGHEGKKYNLGMAGRGLKLLERKSTRPLKTGKHPMKYLKFSNSKRRNQKTRNGMVSEAIIDSFLNKIICGDTVEIMKGIPDGSVPLVITSPPYNLKNSTGNGMKDGRGGKWANAALVNGYSHHNDSMPHDEYVKWQRECLTEMLRIIPNDGAIFYNHKWRVQGGLLQDRQDIVKDFPVRQIIIWRRKGGFNFNAGYFLPTYEVIYLIAKPNFKLIPKANAHGDIWEFTQEMNNEHPAAFPVKLIDRIVSSTNAKIVLDPFMGSGTTAISAINFNRDYIGIEKSPEYCDMARKRIKQKQSQYQLC